MTMTKSHPLYISELIYRIGWFLPDEYKLVRLGRDNFCHTNLSACVQVNHLWHHTLTPLLWTIFYADVIASRDIAPSVVQANSHHIRYAYFNSHLQIPVLCCTRLRKLDVRYLKPMEIRDLTRSNPQLESLTIDLNSEPIALSLGLILEPLADLTRLTLIGTTSVTLELLIPSLRHLTKLRRLKVKDLTKLRSINTPPSQVSTSTDHTPLPKLSSVTELVFSCQWRRNPDLPDLVRYCPNLESLSFELTPASRHIPEFPSARLSNNLRECCPNLTSIRAIRKESVTQPSELTQNDHFNLLQSTSRVVHYDFPVSNFDTAFCDALLAHESSLEMVRIVCNDVGEEQFRNACRILSSCLNLTSFSLTVRDGSSWPEEGLVLFAQPWNFPQLQELELCAFKPSSKRDFRDRLNAGFHELWKHEETHERLPSLVEISEESLVSLALAQSRRHGGVTHWTRVLVQHPPPDPMFEERLAREGWAMAGCKSGKYDRQRKDSSRLEKILEDKVFERVFAMPCMRKVTLENYVFVKKGRAAPSR
ncbi:hypothetical protein BGZ81_006635 [Podila clonocystis]|nr:hypothetical protein BGZ81_006635 [Podila clonocystis]